MDKISRRRFLGRSTVGLLTISPAMAALLSACGVTPASSTHKSNKPGASASKGGKHLEMWTFSGSRSVWEKNVAKKFAALHPGVTINVTVYPYFTMHDKLAAAIFAGSGGPDLSDIEVNEIGRFFTPPIGLVPLNNRIATAGGTDLFYVGEAFAPATWNGKIYGVGSEIDPVIMYLRRDMLEKVGIHPSTDYLHQPVIDTWDDFIRIGKEIRKATGAYMMGVDYTIGTGQFDMINLARGGGMFDAQGRPQLNSQINIETLSFLYDLIHKHQIAFLSPGGYQSTGPSYQAIAGSKIAAVLDASWYGYYIQSNAGHESGDWIIQRAPRWPTGKTGTATYGGTWQCILNQSPNQDLAWEFIKFMNFNRENILDEYKVGALFPSLKSASTSTIFQKGNSFFSNQSIGLLTKELAGALEPVHTSPLWTSLVLPSGILPVHCMGPVLVSRTKTPAAGLNDAQGLAQKEYTSAYGG